MYHFEHNNIACDNVIVMIIKVQLQAKDDQILSLTAENEKLQITVDNLEQYTRRASVRFYGIPESTPGSTDDKILTLCNTHLKFSPPLRREEIEVSHRIGKTEGKWDAVTKPRPIILKFVSRRDKSRMMQSRKKLRNLHPDTRRPRGRAGVDDDDDALTTPEGEDPNSDTIRSVKKNLDKLETYLNTLGFPFSIVALSETWLQDTTCTLYNLPGYSFIEQHRRERTGGGVGLFIKEGIHYFERPDLKYSDDNLESVFIEVDKDSFLLGKAIVIGVIYRPPGTEINVFNKVL